MTTTHDAPTSASGTADAPQGYALRGVDPATLVDNPQNAATTTDRGGLATSVGAAHSQPACLARPLEYGRSLETRGRATNHRPLRSAQQQPGSAGVLLFFP